MVDEFGKPLRSPSRLNLDAINEVALRQIRAKLDDAMMKKIVRLYGPDGKMVYADLGLGGLAELVSGPKIQENLTFHGAHLSLEAWAPPA